MLIKLNIFPNGGRLMDEKYVRNGKQKEWVKTYQSQFSFFNLRLEKEEYAAIKSFAAQRGTSMNDLIRKAALAEIEAHRDEACSSSSPASDSPSESS